MIDFKINKDGYYIVKNNFPDFSYEIAIRGYQIKSWNNFQLMVGNKDENVVFREVTKEDYDLKFYGDWKSNLPETPKKVRKKSTKTKS